VPLVPVPLLATGNAGPERLKAGVAKKAGKPPIARAANLAGEREPCRRAKLVRGPIEGRTALDVCDSRRICSPTQAPTYPVTGGGIATLDSTSRCSRWA
jgi:hypothetical protein